MDYLDKQEKNKLWSIFQNIDKKELSKEDQEKLDDLNKMLELGVISQKEHDEMKHGR